MANMFCFQCEQTAMGKGCAGAQGVCGKKQDTALLQDELTGALIGLARAAQGQKPGPSAHRAMLEGLFTTITNVNFDNESISGQIDAVHTQKETLLAFRAAIRLSPLRRL
jgi:hydroxylamine reductase